MLLMFSTYMQGSISKLMKQNIYYSTHSVIVQESQQYMMMNIIY